MRDVTGVTVSFPDELLIASKENSEQFKRRVLLQTLGSLYVEGKISAGLAAQVLGCDKWEIYRLFSESGFAVIDYDEDELASEALSSRELAERITTSGLLA